MNKLLYKNKYRVESLRLKSWDYSSNGKYFITISTKNSKSYFGEIINRKIILNNIGKIAEKHWKEIPSKFPNAILDEFIIMPNHIHGIIIINNKNNKKKPNINHDPTSRDEIYHVSKDPKKNPKKGLEKGLKEDLEEGLEEKRCNKCAFVLEEYYDGVGRIIRWYKGRCSFEINKFDKNISFKWLPRYYDIIIRNEKALNNIRNYIILNPIRYKKK